MNSTKTIDNSPSIHVSHRKLKSRTPYTHGGEIDRPFRNGSNTIGVTEPIKKSYMEIKYNNDNMYHRYTAQHLRDINHLDAISENEIYNMKYHYSKNNPVVQRTDKTTLNFGNYMRKINDIGM